MPLNIACVGREYPPVTTNVTLDAMQKYARAYNDDNPAFFDASRAGGIVAPPMFGVTVTWNALMKAMMDRELHVDLLRLVHGEQDMEFPNPIRPGDVIDASAKIISIEAKTTGETMTVELNAATLSVASSPSVAAPNRRLDRGVIVVLSLVHVLINLPACHAVCAVRS